MLQRIQTVYLLISLCLIGILFFLPLSEFLIDGKELYIFSLYGISVLNVTDAKIVDSLPLVILNSVIAVSILINIFLFKNRPMQIRISTYLIILIIGFYGMLSFYILKLANNFDLVIHYSFTLVLPLIAIVFIFLALKAIRKDEILVRSADRLR